ncbi:MAG: hypothetical protein RSB51_02090 [Clostridia bacterium]
MSIIVLLIAFLVYLILFTLVSTLVEMAVRIATRTRLSLGKLFLPSTLILVLWGAVGFVVFKVVLNTYGMDILNTIINSFLKVPSLPPDFSVIFGAGGIAIFVTIILQSCIIYIVNFDVSKPFKILFFKATTAIKNSMLSLFKVKPKAKVNPSVIAEANEKFSIDLLSCVFSSIVIFLIVIFFIVLMSFLSHGIVTEILPLLLKKI